MAASRIISFRIEVAPNGGFINGQTADGQTFSLSKRSYPEITAITAVVKGPNAAYDHANRVFICEVTSTPVTVPLISGGIEGLSADELSF